MAPLTFTWGGRDLCKNCLSCSQDSPWVFVLHVCLLVFCSEVWLIECVYFTASYSSAAGVSCNLLTYNILFACIGLLSITITMYTTTHLFMYWYICVLTLYLGFYKLNLTCPVMTAILRMLCAIFLYTLCISQDGSIPSPLLFSLPYVAPFVFSFLLSALSLVII